MKSPIIEFLAARLREPSTWGGLVALLTTLSVKMSPELSNQIIACGVAIGGLLMILIKEAGSDK